MSALIVGIGSPHGDDALGWRVVEELLRAPSPHFRAVALRTPADLLTELADRTPPRLLGLVDAVVDETAAPGTIVRTTGDALGTGPARGTRSSHGLGLRDALRAARALDRLPARVVLWGVVATSTEPGADLSEPVASAVQRVVAEIREELAQFGADEAIAPSGP